MTYYTLVWLTWACPAFIGSALGPFKPLVCTPELHYERDSNPADLEKRIGKLDDGIPYIYLRESRGRTKELKVEWLPSFER